MGIEPGQAFAVFKGKGFCFTFRQGGGRTADFHMRNGPLLHVQRV